MAVGRPIKLTPNVARKSITVTATEGQTSFTPTGGYRINELGVFRNGVRLVQGKDFTASDGSTVTLQSGATVGDVVEFQVWDSFNIADAISANGNQTMGGDLTVGLTTMYSGATGIVSTTQFFGDGSNLTGVANTDYIDAASITSAGIGGLWIAAPGTQIDSSSGINGWLRADQAYAGSGIPGSDTGNSGNGSNGCAATSGDVIEADTALSGTYDMTLGEENLSNATGNVALIRIALSSGQSVTALSIS